MECEVKVSSKINPTESPEKVREAVEYIFPNTIIKITEDSLELEGDCDILKNLKEIMEKRKIRSTARSIMESYATETQTEFTLNKQTALVGIVNFVEGTGSDLGEIEVKIKSKDINSIMDWLAPVEVSEEIIN